MIWLLQLTQLQQAHIREVTNGLDKVEMNVVEVKKTKPHPQKHKLTTPNKKTMSRVSFFGTNVLSFGI
jgi:hypothetical protein